MADGVNIAGFLQLVETTTDTTGANGDWLEVPSTGSNGRAFIDLSIYDSHASPDFTVVLQRKRRGEADSVARNIESFTTESEKLIEMAAGGWLVRLNVTVHTQTSTLTCELSVV